MPAGAPGSAAVQPTSVMLPVPVSNLQVVTSPTSGVAIHQQILIQSRPLSKELAS